MEAHAQFHLWAGQAWQRDGPGLAKGGGPGLAKREPSLFDGTHSTLLYTMGIIQVKPLDHQPRMEVGVIDPRLNESVTYVAEMDMSAAQEEIRQLRRGLCPLFAILLFFSLCNPCMLLAIYCIYSSQKNRILSGVEQTQAYITDSTFVLISPHLPIERARTTVPLANIATVTTQGHSLWVNIKPTAPEVTMNSNQPSAKGAYLTYTTRSIPVEKIKNVSIFADAIREHITA